MSPPRPALRARSASGSLGGFTLIEVLVALGLVAVVLIAGFEASAALSRSAQRQTDLLLGQLCAENELVKARLSRQMPAVGDSSVECEQGGRHFQVRTAVRPTPNPSFRRIDAHVWDDTTPVLQLSTVIGRF